MVQFHFTKDAPDQSTLNNFQNLNNFTEEPFSKFIDILMTFFSGQQANELMDNLGLFAQEQGVNLTALKTIVSGVILFFKGAIKENLTPLYVKEDMSSLGLSEEKAIIVGQKWKSNFVSLSRSFMAQTLTVNELLDMEWRFGVTASTNELKKAGNTFLQLKLVLDKGNNKKEHVHMELTLPQFYQFVNDMEEAKNHLEYFS